MSLFALDDWVRVVRPDGEAYEGVVTDLSVVGFSDPKLHSVWVRRAEGMKADGVPVAWVSHVDPPEVHPVAVVVPTAEIVEKMRATLTEHLIGTFRVIKWVEVSEGLDLSRLTNPDIDDQIAECCKPFAREELGRYGYTEQEAKWVLG